MTVLHDFAIKVIAPAIEDGQAVIILHLGDHDPFGLAMTRDLEDRLALWIEACAIHRSNPVTSRFYLRNRLAGGAADISFRFGQGNQGQVPLASDWGGDGVTTVGLYDPATSRFYLNNSHAGSVAVGLAGCPLRSSGWDREGLVLTGRSSSENAMVFTCIPGLRTALRGI